MSGRVDRLARRFFAMRVVAQVVVCAVTFWFVDMSVTYRQPGRIVGLASLIGAAVLALSLLILARRVARAIPGPEVRDTLGRLERLAPLIVLNLIVLTFVSPFATAAARLPVWSTPTRLSLTLLGELSGKAVLFLLGAAFAALAALSLVRGLDRLAERVPGGQRLGLLAARGAGAAAALYCAWGMAVAFNGAFDTAPPVEHRSEIVAVRGIPQVALRWVELRSWRGGSVERVMVSPARDGDWMTLGVEGRPVTVRVRPGFLGLPWIQSVTLDQGSQWGQLVELLPSAAAPRRALVESLLRQGRWDDAVAHARIYAGYHPGDRGFLKTVSDALRSARQLDAARALDREPWPAARGGGAG